MLVADEAGVCTTEMIPLRGYYGLLPEFLRLAMKSPSFINYANDSTHGMNLPRMGTVKARLALIPLLPEREQHRIVAKVDELMALCDQLEQQQESSITAHQTLVQTLIDALTAASERDGFTAAWARIADHFDTLFTTEWSIDQLKKTILQLAVMGKLVPQDPNDEPTSNCLNGISLGKEKLLRQRRVKYRSISENPEIVEMRYDIPDSWEWLNFQDAVFFQEGPGIRNWQFTAQGIKLLNVSNILVDGNLDFSNSDKYVSEEEFNEKYTHFQIFEDDLLFSGSGASWGKVAWFKDPGFPVMLNTSTMRLRFFHSDFAGNYLLYFLKSDYFKLQLTHQLVGMQPNFGSTHLSRSYIPIPPIDEQRRIVAKVDELMALCDSLKTRINNAQATQLQLADAVVGQVVT